MRERKRVQVICKDCRKEFNKVSYSLKEWRGRCIACAKKEVNSRPEVKKAYRQNGLNYTERFGSSFLNSKRPPQKKIKRTPDYDWKWGISPQQVKDRGTKEILQWKRQVKENSNYTCECCELSTKKLEADHILPFSIFPEYRLDLNNGRALCRPCHIKYGARVMKGVLYRLGYSPIP